MAASSPRPRGPAANRQSQRAYYEHRRALMRMGETPCDLGDASAVRARCDAFFELCASDGCKPTAPGLTLALGATAGDLDAHPTRELWRAMQCVEDVTAQMALDGVSQMSPAIFYMKNWFGYSDDAGRDRSQARAAAAADRAELERKYANVELVAPGDGKGKGR